MDNKSLNINNPYQKLFGPLSNSYIFPFRINGEKYESIVHYIYSNMLLPGNDRVLLKNQKSPKDVLSLYKELYVKNNEKIVQKYLDIAIDFLIKNNPEFKNNLLKTGNSRLIYKSNDPLLGGEKNILGLSYERFRYNITKELKKTAEVQYEKFMNDDIFNVYKVVTYLNRLMFSYNEDLKELIGLQFDELLSRADKQRASEYTQKEYINVYKNGKLEKVKYSDVYKMNRESLYVDAPKDIIILQYCNYR